MDDVRELSDFDKMRISTLEARGWGHMADAIRKGHGLEPLHEPKEEPRKWNVRIDDDDTSKQWNTDNCYQTSSVSEDDISSLLSHIRIADY